MSNTMSPLICSTYIQNHWDRKWNVSCPGVKGQGQWKLYFQVHWVSVLQVEKSFGNGCRRQ